MTPLWILSGVAFALAGILCGISVSHHKFHALWATYVGVALAFAAIFVWWHATIAERDLQAKPPVNLDTSPLPVLSESKTVSPPAIITPTPIASPAQTLATPLPSMTPEHRVASLNFRGAWQKLADALGSAESGKYDEVRNAFKGLPVDWTLNFDSANRDSSGKLMQVWLHDAKQAMGFVVVDLPLAGNERFPLMEQTDVFRVRGIIDDARTTAITLRDATLEYVRSDPKK
jgi:hypothetical protein